MRENAPRPDAAPRRRGVVALLVVVAVAFALAVGLTVHHEEFAPSAPVEVSISAPALGEGIAAALPAPDGGVLLACSVLVLCGISLLLAFVRSRRATPHPYRALRRQTTSPVSPRTRVALTPSLEVLAISRT